MNRTDSEILDYYDNEVVEMIAQKYGMSYMEAFRAFANSKTHLMLENPDHGLTAYGAGALFDLWEAEKVTGKPYNSIYIRGE